DPSNADVVTLSRDGRMLADAYGGGTIKLWDLRMGALRRTLGWDDSVNSIALSPDGKLIAVGGIEEPRLRVWDSRTGALKWIPRGRASDVQSVAFSRDGKLLESTGGDGTVTVWDLKTRA